MSRMVYGVAKNDADYCISERVGSKKAICKYYSTWRSMLLRCFSEKFKAKHPTYTDCTVSNDWLLFSNFRAWMEMQDWKGKDLDKDLLFAGNKIYSAETCLFIPRAVNLFLTDRENFRGDYKVGVRFEHDRGKYLSRCSNPFTKKIENLGRFDTEDDAYLAWKKRKHELACMLSETIQDKKVKEALKRRFA